MAAVISGEGLGLYGSSLNTLGNRGPANDPVLGRYGNQVYVNAATGNLVVRQQDEFLASAGLDTALLRTYNSQGGWDGDNNDQWRLGIRTRLHSYSANASIIKTYGDGAEITFDYTGTVNGMAEYRSTDGDGAHDSLRYDSTANTWTWTDGSSAASEIYEADPVNGGWRLWQCVDADGNATTYSYTGGLVTQISDSSGQTVDLVYSGNNLQSITTTSGTAVQTRVVYGYDDSNRLISVTVDLTPENASDSETFETYYTYDGTSNRIATIDHTGGGAPDLMIGYDPSGRVETLTDGTGNVTQYSYGTNITTVTDPLLRQTHYYYDSNNEGRLTKVESPALTDGGPRLVTEYSYDPSGNGNVVAVKDPTGAIVSFEYDARGNLTRQTDAAGNVVEYTYTPDSLLSSETVYLQADPDYSAVDSVQDGPLQAAEPQTTYYVYDAENHLQFAISPEGKVTEHRYAANGQRVATLVYTADTYAIAPLQTPPSEADLVGWLNTIDLSAVERTDYDYDFRGQLGSTTRYDAVAADGSVTASPKSVTYFIYDQAGQLLKTINPRNYETLYVYDGLGRLTTQTDAAGNITHTDYDDANNRVSTTYANGLMMTRVYDNGGRLISSTDYEPTNASALSTHYNLYDTAGQLRVSIDANGASTYYFYDGAGRQVASIDPEGLLTEIVYDGAGRVQQTLRYATPVSHALRDQLAVDPALLDEIAALSDSPTTKTATGTFTATADNVSNTQTATFTNDTTSETADLTVSSIYETTQTPSRSANIDTFAWVPDGNGSLVQTPGFSLQPGTALFDDTSPTEVKATIHRSDGTVYDTVYTQVGSTRTENIILNTGAPQQPYGYQASATTDTVSTANQNVTMTVNSTQQYLTYTQTSNVANYGWTYNSSTHQIVSNGSGYSLVANSATHVDDTPTQVYANIHKSDGTFEQTQYLVVGNTTSYTVTDSYTGQQTTYYDRHPATNWNGHVNLGSLGPGNYYAEIWTEDQATSGNTTSYPGRDGDSVWYRNNTVNFTIGGQIPNHIDTRLSWPNSITPSGTTSITFRYKAPGSSTWVSKSVGLTGSTRYVDFDHATNGTYTYEITYKDTYNRVLKSTTSTFVVNGTTDSSPAATFQYPSYSSSATSGASIPAFTMTAAEVAKIDYLDAKVYQAGTTTQVGSTALTYAAAHADYFADSQYYVNLRTGSALPNGQYDVKITKHFKDGTASTVTQYMEVGLQPEPSNQNKFWDAVDNWSGQVNLLVGAGSLPDDTYQVDIAVRDDAPTYGSYNGTELGSTTAPGADGDGTWQQLTTVSATFDTITTPSNYDTTLAWSNALQPADTDVEFGYRPMGSTAPYTIVPVTEDLGTYSVTLDQLQAGDYEYRIRYLNRNDALLSVLPSQTLDQLRPQAGEDDRQTYNVYDEAGRLTYAFDAEGYVTEYKYNGAGDVIDTIEHSTAFPGFINNDENGIQVTTAGNSTLIEWIDETLSTGIPDSAAIDLSIVEEETGQGLQVSFDLATSTGMVSTTREPEQPFDYDLYAANDTRTVVDVGSIDISTQHEIEEIPDENQQYAIQRSVSYAFDKLTSTITSISNDSVPDSAGVGRNTPINTTQYSFGISTTQSSNINQWSWFFYHDGSEIASGGSNTPYVSVTLSSSLVDDDENYSISIRPETSWGPGSPVYRTFSVGHYEANTITIPDAGASNVVFQYRDVSQSGTSWSSSGVGISHVGSSFEVDLPYSLNSHTIDFRIFYKNSAGDVIKAVNGTRTLPGDGGSSGQSTHTAYTMTEGSGISLLGVLTPSEVGDFGDELPTTLQKVEVKVYEAGTTNLVAALDPIYPSVLKEFTGEELRAINLTDGTTLSPGIYDIEVIKFPNAGGSSTMRIDDFQVGDIQLHHQNITWPASVQPLEAGESATFFYRKQGEPGFVELPLVSSSTDPSYFVRNGSEYKVRLHDLDPAAIYEYKIEYRDVDKGLLKWTDWTTLDADVSVTSGVIFKQYQYQSIAPASGQAGGARLVGYLAPQDIQAIDYLSVNVWDETQTTLLHENVLTFPKAEPNYQGELNLTVGQPLVDGSYIIEVNRHYNDPEVAVQSTSFNYEVGLQTISAQALTVNAAGDMASYAGDLVIASGLALTLNRTTGDLSIEAQTLDRGPYCYTQSITDVGGIVIRGDEGRFTVFDGPLPEIDAVNDYYNRDRVVSVEVTQGTSVSYSNPELPDGYSYVTSAQGVATAREPSSFELTAINELNHSYSPNIQPEGYIFVGETTGSQGSSYYTTGQRFTIYNSSGVAVYYLDHTTAPPGTSVTSKFYIPSFILNSNTSGVYTLKVGTEIGNNNIFEYTSMYWRGTGATYTYTFEVVSTPASTTVEWPVETRPTGTTVQFKYKPWGVANFQVPSSITTQNGKLIAGISGGAPGTYEYIIEYRDGAGELVKDSRGFFQIEAGESLAVGRTMLEYYEVASSINGSSLISETLSGRTDIEQVEAVVVNAQTGQTFQIVTNVPAGQALNTINLKEGDLLDDGSYQVTLTVHHTNGTVDSPVSFMIEVGKQPVESPLTELRWDATNRPANTDVYFRYKPEAQYEFAPENMWIRATASHSPDGKIYTVRFPQTTPDGLYQLDSLSEGRYDYMIAYVDRDTGKEVESALGQFDVIHTNGGPDQVAHHQITFTRDLDERHTRLFYNDIGQKTGELDALGYLTEYRYDVGGRLIETIRYENKRFEGGQYQEGTRSVLRAQSSLDSLRPSTSENDQRTRYFHDGQGRPVMTVDAEGFVTERLYDSAGNVTQTTRYYNPTAVTDFSNATVNAIRPVGSDKDQITLSTYTSLNQLDSVTESVNGTSITTTTYQYDAMGHVVSTITAAGTSEARTIGTYYDLQGNLVTRQTAEGSAAYIDWLTANPGATPVEKDVAAQQILLDYGVFYQYDAAGNRISAQDQNDLITRYYFDARGQITHVVNAAGEVTETVYDAFGEAVQTIQYATRVDSATLAGLAGGLVSPAVKAIFEGLRDIDNDSVTEQTYEHRGLLASRTDALGHETRYVYNAFGEQRFARQTLQGGQHDGQLYEIEYIYDLLGRRTNVINNTGGDQLSQGFDYDAFGRQVAAYTYDSNQTLHEHYYRYYDKLGRVTEQVEVLDIPTSTTHTINAYTYDAFSRTLTHTDGNNQTTSYVYDDVNRSMTITTPEGISTTTRTNRHGETVEVIDGNNQSTLFAYNKNGQRISTTDAEGNETTRDYDPAGRLILTTDAEGHEVAIYYDAANRVFERIVDPTGLALSTKTYYDAKGRVIESVDPQDVITRTTYDKNGQVTSIIVDARPEGDTSEENAYLSLATFYTYDSRGNTLTETVGGTNTWIDATDEAGNPIRIFNQALTTTEYRYDIHGRLQTKIIDPGYTNTDSLSGQSIVHDGLNITRTYQYDAAGNLIAETNPRGYTTRNVYDRFNRLIYTIAGVENDRGLVTEYRYDGNNHRLAELHYANTIDLYGLSEAPTLAEVEPLVTAIASQDDRLQQNVYDNDGRWVYTVNPAGIVSKNVYDANNNIVQVIRYADAVPVLNGGIAVTYESVSDIETALAGANLADARQAWSVYDHLGRALYNVDSLGHVTENVYDGNGRVVRTLAYAQPIDTALLADPATARGQVQTAVSTLADPETDRITRYVYDAAGRQVYKIDAEGYITETRYDAAGRAVERIAYATAYSGLSATPTLSEIGALLPAEPGEQDRVSRTDYDAAGRLIRETDAEGHAEEYQYDGAGNRTGRTAANGAQWTYRYDAANRLIEEISPVVDVTRLDAALWEQNFEGGSLQGLIAGSPIAGAFTVNDGRLEVLTQNNATAVTPSLTGERLYSFDEPNANARIRFQAEINVGPDATQRYLFFGAQNNQSDTAYRSHGALFDGNTVYAVYDDGSGLQTQTLGSVSNNVTYVVELVTHETGTTLYVYEQGTGRETGYRHDLSLTDWGTARTYLYTRAGSMQAGGLSYIDNIRELMPRERALMNEGSTLSAVIEGESIMTRYEYNAMGDVIARIEAANTPEERRTDYFYDPLNRQVAVSHPEVGVYNYVDENLDYASSRQETLERLTETTYYDTFGNAIAGVDTAGNISYKVYDRANRLKYEIDANGYVTQRDYDAFGNVEVLTRYASPVTLAPADISQGVSLAEVQQALSPDVAKDRVLITGYDKLGRATQVEQGAVTVATLDANGQATLSQASPTVQKQYNAFGQLTRQSTLAAGGQWLDTYYYYDPNGNRAGRLDPEHYLTLWEYDRAGNVTRKVEYAQSLGDPAQLGNEYDPSDYDAVLGKVQSRSLSTAAPDQLGYPLQRSSSVGAYLDGYIPSADIAAVDYIEAKVFKAGTAEQVGQTALTHPADITGYNGEVYLSEHTPLNGGRYDIQITVYWNDGRVPTTTVNLDQTALTDVAYVPLPEYALNTAAPGVQTTETFLVDATEYTLVPGQYQTTDTVSTPVDYDLNTSALVSGSGSSYYEVQSGDTWNSIATTLYGTVDVADELEAHYSSPALTAGLQLADPPATLTDTVTTVIPVNPYYEIQAGDIWGSIAMALYGDAAVAEELEAFYSSMTLTAGERLADLPAMLVDGEQITTEVDPYYIVQSGDTWASLATAMYGASDVADALRAHYQGGETPTPGERLSALPLSLAVRAVYPLTGSDPYTVQAGDTWSSIATTLYGSADLAAELKTALDHPVLQAGMTLSSLPLTLAETGLALVTPHYTVQPGDSWESLAAKFYGTGQAATALRVALGDNALLPGQELTLPASLSYAPDTATLSGYEVGPQLISNVGVPEGDLIGHDRETRYTYDRLNRQLSETQLGVTVSEVDGATVTTNIVNLTTERSYDAVGNLVSETDAAGNIVYRFYDALGRLTGETEVSRTQQRYGIEAETVVFVEDGELRWARPPIPGLNAELRLRPLGESTWSGPYTPAQTQDWLRYDAGSFPSGQYEYEIIYTRAGENQTYATAAGEINLFTNTSSGAVNLAYKVIDDGDTLIIAGATAGLTHVVIDGTNYTAFDQGNGEYHIDLSTLGRGNYSFTTAGASTQLTGQVQKLTGATGGAFAIQTVDIGIGYEILSQVNYEFDSHDPRWWGNNRIEINFPELTHLGTNGLLSYEVTLEFSNVYGNTTERTYSGSVSGSTVLIDSEITSHDENSQYMARLERMTHIKLWRTDPVKSVELDLPDGSFVQGASISVSGQRHLVAEANGGMQTQRLEFINLPDAESAVFAYRPVESNAKYKYLQLKKIGDGQFAIGNRGIAAGAYEYMILRNGDGPANAYATGTIVIGHGVNSPDAVSVSQAASPGEVTEAETLTPLTIYQRDAFGNVVKQTRYADSRLNALGDVVIDPRADYASVYTYYDTHGKKVQVQDAEGNSRFFSYDVRGNLAKEWQWITTRTGSAVPGQRLFSGSVYKYDAVGRQIEQIEIGETLAANDQGIVVGSRDYEQLRTQLVYNAFGEVITRTHYGFAGQNGDERVEYFDYDNAGRLWRTNAGDGVTKIFLYDVQGNRVQTLASQTTELGGTAYDEYDELAAAAVAADIRKTSTEYDALGRKVREQLPVRDGLLSEFNYTLDRWGNVTRQVDAGDASTDSVATEWYYDGQNRQIKQVQAADNGVAVADPDNLVSTKLVTPETHFYYDALGREVATKDAKDRLRINRYDQAGQLTEQVAADGGVQRFVYDGLGRQTEHVRYRGDTDSTPYIASRIYDLNGRLLSEYMPGGGETHYTYDEAGNRLSVKRLESRDNITGQQRYSITRYRYDNRGNLIEEVRNAEIEVYDSAGSLITGMSGTNYEAVMLHYGYDAYNRKALEQHYPGGTTGMISAGWSYNGFGHLADHIDFGGGDYDYSYNAAGQITSETVTRSGQSASKTYDYYADGRLESLTRNDTSGTVVDRYVYDIKGRMTEEYSNVSGQAQGNRYHIVTTYDTLGRVSSVHSESVELLHDTSEGNRGYYLDVNYTYDAVGNRVRVQGVEGMKFAYTENVFVQYGQNIVVNHPDTYGVDGFDHWYAYDAENRVLVSQGRLEDGEIVVAQRPESVAYRYDKAGNRIQTLSYDKNDLVTEDLHYDAAGNLRETLRNNDYTSKREYDLLGRMVRYEVYDAYGQMTEVQTTEYDDNGQRLWQHNYEVVNGVESNAINSVNFFYDSAGNLEHYKVTVYGDNGYFQNFYYAYNYFETAQVAEIEGIPSKTSYDAPPSGTFNPAFDPNTTVHNYDVYGNLVSVTNTNTKLDDRDLGYSYNAAGQLIQKAQGESSYSRYQFYYYQNGIPLATGGSLHKLDVGLSPMNAGEAGSLANPGDYVVREGDTLRSIALSVYGDAQLWYLIADANGLRDDDDLIEGMNLHVPASVTSLHNSADTFQAFDPGKFIGDTSPHLEYITPPPPPAPDKSNPFVAIVAVIVAVVVTVYTGGKLGKVMWKWAAGMIGAAAGNAAGQAINIAGGNQEKFDGDAFRTAAIGGAIGGTFGKATNGAIDAGNTAASAGYAALGNIIGQGIAVELGYQEAFSWASVATAAIGGAANANGASGFGSDLFLGLWGGVAQGMEFGNLDMGNAALNAFGQAIGNSLVGQAQRRAQWNSPEHQEALLNKMLSETVLGTASNPLQGQSSAPVSNAVSTGGPNASDSVSEEVVVTGYRQSDGLNRLVNYWDSVLNGRFLNNANRQLQSERAALSYFNALQAEIKANEDWSNLQEQIFDLSMDQAHLKGFRMGMERTEFGSGWDVGDLSEWTIDQKLGFSGNLLTQGIDDSLAQLEQWAVDARDDYRDAGANLYASDHKFAAAAAAFLTGAVELGTRAIEGFASTARLGTNSYLREQAISGLGYAAMHPGEVLGGVVDTLANNTYDQNLVLAMEFMLGGGHKALGGLASLSLKAGRKGLSFARAAGSAILEEMSRPVSLRQLQAGHLRLDAFIPGFGEPLSVPQGMTAREFAKFRRAARVLAREAGLPEGQLAVHGSRARGTATVISDIDVILRVNEKQFFDFAQKRVSSVVPGTKLHKTLLAAARSGQLSRFDISNQFNSLLRKTLVPKSQFDIDFSIIKQGSKMDTGPFIDLGKF